MRYNDSTKSMTNPVSTDEILWSCCRNHIESLQNLGYLVALEAEHPQQVRLRARMIEWHLRILTDVLFPPTSPVGDEAYLRV